MLFVSATKPYTYLIFPSINFISNSLGLFIELLSNLNGVIGRTLLGSKNPIKSRRKVHCPQTVLKITDILPNPPSRHALRVAA